MYDRSTRQGGSILNGDLAELYFHTPATWFDPSSGGDLAKFMAAVLPVDLGATGSTPLGVQPLVRLNAGTTGAWPTNNGSGLGFTEVGALTDGVVPLPTAGAAYEQTDYQFFNDNGTGLGPPP